MHRSKRSTGVSQSWVPGLANCYVWSGRHRTYGAERSINRQLISKAATLVLSSSRKTNYTCVKSTKVQFGNYFNTVINAEMVSSAGDCTISYRSAVLRVRYWTPKVQK